MAFKTETVTVLPALILFIISSYLAFLTSLVADSSAQKALFNMALSLFIGGLILAVCWGCYWGIHRKFREKDSILP
jgi:hypothetical protein